MTPRPIRLIRAPSNLGLRPLAPGHVPGTWRAPEALARAGLEAALAPSEIVAMTRPVYEAEVPPGTAIRNGLRLREFNLALADQVAAAERDGRFPLVVGGDCSVLLGALAGCRRRGELSLVHVDGHSDFRHPGNHDFAREPGTAAGMDLALATGRGEPLLTEWPGVSAPLVPDEQVVQLGEREGRDADFAWPDVAETGFERIDAFEAAGLGAGAILARIVARLDRRPDWRFWLHLDVDVLDQAVMPAVDSPGSPGVDPPVLTHILSALLADRRCAGMTVCIFDPDLDPTGRYARWLVGLLTEAFAAHRSRSV